MFLKDCYALLLLFRNNKQINNQSFVPPLPHQNSDEFLEIRRQIKDFIFFIRFNCSHPLNNKYLKDF